LQKTNIEDLNLFQFYGQPTSCILAQGYINPAPPALLNSNAKLEREEKREVALDELVVFGAGRFALCPTDEGEFDSFSLDPAVEIASCALLVLVIPHLIICKDKTFELWHVMLAFLIK